MNDQFSDDVTPQAQETARCPACSSPRPCPSDVCEHPHRHLMPIPDPIKPWDLTVLDRRLLKSLKIKVDE